MKLSQKEKEEELVSGENSEFTKEELDLLIDGPIWKAIASMSIPMMLTALAISAATFADAFVAGKLQTRCKSTCCRRHRRSNLVWLNLNGDCHR